MLHYARMQGRRALLPWTLATLIPCLFAGVAATCSLGELTVTSVGRPSRLGVLPPPWVFGLALASAATVAVLLRRSRASVAPLLLGAVTLVPWLPMPVPAVVLALAGPLRWSLWAAAAILLVAAAPPLPGWTSTTWLASARRAPLIAALLAVFAFAGIRAVIGERIPTGDEPHYLLLTQSMISDGDLDVENNYARGDYASYYGGDLDPHWYVRGLGNRGILFHLPGVPALIAPAFAFGGAAAAAGWLALLSAAGTALVWRYGYALTGDATSAWFGWATATLTLPLVAQAGMIYPDAPGAVIVVALMLALASDERARQARQGGRDGIEGWSRSTTLLLGLGCAMLPWLHTRLALPALSGALCLLIRMRTWHRRWSHGLILVGLLLAGIGSWLWYFEHFYGVWDPRAPYGSQTPFAPSAAVAGAIAMFADQQAGLLPNAPVYALACYGLWLLAKAKPRLTVEYAVMAVPYLLLGAGFHMWWGGASVPGRLMLAVLLPFAAGTSLAWKHGTRAGRLASLVLLGLSVLAAASRVWGGDGALLLPDSGNRNQWLDWLSPVVDLTPGLPGYFSAPGSLPSDALIWIVAMAVSLGVGRWVVLRLRWRETAQATACVAAACVGAMVAIDVLWARSAAVRIAPAASQLGLLVRVRDHGVTRVRDVSHAAWLDVGDALARLRIGSDRLPSRAEDPGLKVSGVPPGRFLVETRPGDLPGPRVALWIGRSSTPLEEWPSGQAGSPGTWELTLPAGASAVVARAA